jgi:hypothetical protein
MVKIQLFIPFSNEPMRRLYESGVIIFSKYPDDQAMASRSGCSIDSDVCVPDDIFFCKYAFISKQFRVGIG